MRKSGWFCLAAALALTACNPFEAANVTEDAVAAHHSRYNNRMFNELYKDSDYALRREVEYRDFNEAMQNLHQSMGEVVSTEQKQIDFQKTASGPDRASVLMVTTFEYGVAQENFVFSLGQQVKLVSYGYEITVNDIDKRIEERMEMMREQAERISAQPPPRPVRNGRSLTEEEIRQLRPEIREALRKAGAI